MYVTWGPKEVFRGISGGFSGLSVGSRGVIRVFFGVLEGLRCVNFGPRGAQGIFIRVSEVLQVRFRGFRRVLSTLHGVRMVFRGNYFRKFQTIFRKFLDALQWRVLGKFHGVRREFQEVFGSISERFRGFLAGFQGVLGDSSRSQGRYKRF